MSGRESFITFVRQLREVMKAIAASPMVQGSGEYEIKKEKVYIGRRTTGEMVNKTAQQLLNLKNKRAYVSIGSRGKKYKPRVKTMPLPEIDEEAKERLLHARKTQAIENAKKYTTAKEDIEIQYRERRLAFIRGGIPQGQVQGAVTEEPSHTSNTPIKETPPASVRIAKRRDATFTPIQVSHAPGPKAYKLTDTDILYCLYQFRHLTIDQLARAVQRESSKNNVRTIINTRLIRQGLVSSSSPGGRSAYIYSLTKKGKKALEAEKGTLPDMADTGYSTHLHNVNNLLIPAILLPQVEPRIRLSEWQHAEAFKVTPIAIGNNKTVIPDGFVSYVLSPPFGKEGEPVGIILEWDEGTESLTQLRDKLLRYITFASGPYQDTFHLDTLTIAFLASETERVAKMKVLAEEVTKARKNYADLFLFAALNTAETDPLTLFTTPLFHQPFDINLHALIEPGA